MVGPFNGRSFNRIARSHVEHEARTRGCRKVTLEVLEGNRVACRAYERRFRRAAWRVHRGMRCFAAVFVKRTAPGP
jgi:ribosomal protein S18 acetylase RimI-like enzyme